MSNFYLSDEQYFCINNGKLYFHYITEHKTLRSSKELDINPDNLLDWLNTNVPQDFKAEKYRANIDQKFVDDIRGTLKRLNAKILIDEDTAIGQIIGTVDSLKRRKRL
jgi:hypothetical protein